MLGRVEGQSEPVKLVIAVVTPTVIRLTIEGSKFSHRAGLNFNMTGLGPFFGLGERFGEIKLDGKKITLRPEDRIGTPGHDWSYLPTPFLFTPLGLGLYLDTFAQSVFDLTLADQGHFTSQVMEPSIDCYFFVGDPKEMLGDYTSLTGRTPLPPPWALGVWVNSIGGQGAVRQDAIRIRQQRIPVSALWTFDVMDDESNLGYGGTGWPVGYYGLPGNFNSQLHQLGFKVLGYITPTVRSMLLPYNTPSSAFQEGLSKQYFVLKPHGQPSGSHWCPFRREISTSVIPRPSTGGRR